MDYGWVFGFERMKICYVTAIKLGVMSGLGYYDLLHGNELLHELCKGMISQSNCNGMAKEGMKQQILLLKEDMGQKIENYFR